MQKHVEWSFLEVDEEEWQQRTCSPETAPVANGFPIYVGREQNNTAGGSQGRNTHGVQQGALVAAAVVLLLVAAVGFGAWYVAEQGISHMGQEVANVVKLESIKAHAKRPEQHEQTTVESVEFLDGKAMVQAAITLKWSSGQVMVRHQTQFYTQTPHGWQRVAPVAAFWGAPQELDTPNLHFVFRSKDRAAVVQLAPGLDALYTTLRRALGQGLAAANDRLTVEVVPEQVPPDQRFVAGRMRLTSPLLYDLSFDYTASTLLARLARQALVVQMWDQTQHPLKANRQWALLLDRLRTWLQYSDTLPLTPTWGSGISPGDLKVDSSLQLADLLSCSPCAGIGVVYWLPNEQEQSAAIDSLIDFITATYGLDVLPALLTGFDRYEDWDTLAPAVFDVTPNQLEMAWYAWLDTEAK